MKAGPPKSPGCRHTFASLIIAAGVNAKALSAYCGHANISITLDRDGHLMHGRGDPADGRRAYEDAVALLEDHRDELDALARVLLDRDRSTAARSRRCWWR